ncbi:MAG TPA: hypothetical protein VFN34_07550 [Ornithinibacter sp.]|jgi:hypothetical protein|nr:hypothetical protein [Ornithinibacter sp.]
MSLQIVITVIVAGVLGALASFGLYQVAQPAAFSSAKPIYTYGVTK